MIHLERFLSIFGEKKKLCMVYITRLNSTQHREFHLKFFFFRFFKFMASPPNFTGLNMAKRPLAMQNFGALGPTVTETRSFKVQEAPHNVTFREIARIATKSYRFLIGREKTCIAKFEARRTNGFRDTAF